MQPKLPQVKCFISYSHKDRAYAAQVKKILEEMEIEAFLAHEDIRVSEVWRSKILQELANCDMFIPILSANFLASEWAPQEVGFITSRPKVAVAPISIDSTVSFGFISHIQSKRIPKSGLSQSILIDSLAAIIPRKILPRLIRAAGDARSFRSAESLMEPLVSHFERLTKKEAQALAKACVENGQVWSAHLCRTEYLPRFIKAVGGKVESSTLRALRYQVRYNKKYAGKKSREA